MKRIISAIARTLWDARELIAYGLPGLVLALGIRHLFCDPYLVGGITIIAGAFLSSLIAHFTLTDWQRRQNKKIASRSQTIEFNERLRGLEKHYREVQGCGFATSILVTITVTLASVVGKLMIGIGMSAYASFAVGLAIAIGGIVLAVLVSGRDWVVEGNRSYLSLVIIVVCQAGAVAYQLSDLCPI